MENPQSWNRYSYTINNPLKYTDSTGHCFEPASALICAGLLILGAVAVKAGYDAMRNSAQHPVEMAQEQQAAKQWQDNCMGQCHYSDSVTPTPNINIGGERPDTPYNDQYAEGAWTLANGVAMIAGVGASAVNALTRPTTGIKALQELDSISTDTGINIKTVQPGEDAFEWFNDIIGGGNNAKSFPKGGPKAPTLYGDIPEGGSAYYRPRTSTNPAIEIKNVPGYPKYRKYHFPLDD